jgi:CheY-like chemotaxis protein
VISVASNTNPRKIETMAPNVILLAEDNPDDAFIFKTMFERAGLPQSLHHVEDGKETIQWLSGEGICSDRKRCPLPDILLLDLKMPVKSGFEVLEWLRTQSQFKKLRVVVLSSSDDQTDVKRAHSLGVSKYFVKSPHFQDIIDYLRLSQTEA